MALQKVYDALGGLYYVEVTELDPDSQGRIGKRQIMEIGATTPPTGYTTTNEGSRTVTTAGTAVQLSTTSVTCKLVTLCADPTNTKNIHVGGIGIDSTKGFRLFPGAAKDFYVSNLNLLYIDVEAGGDGHGITFIYFN